MKKYWLKRIRRAMVIVLVISFTHCTATDPKAEQEAKIQEIIAKMSLDQKAKLVAGTGMHFELPDSIAARFPRPPKQITDSAYDEMVNQVRKSLPGAAGFTAEYPELGITTQVLADGPAGLRVSPKRKGEDRTYYCTAFPIATMMASSWDTELVYNVGKAMGEEVLAYNADVILGPGMNIQRDPLCGRNFEYYSEDPIVIGKMGAAMVNGVQSNGIGTSVKHFAANNQETNRMSVNTIVSERALREIYLRGFEIAVTEGKPWTVMSSYNIINGTYAPESHDLLTKILRDDWGFEGYVMTDWGGGSDPVAMMQAGNDLLMPGQEQQIKDIVAAVNEGRLSESVLDKNISRMLAIMMKSPKQSPDFNPSNEPDLKAHAEVTRKAATEGMVLLENKDNALPIAGDIKQVALFGTTSYEFISGGTGSGDVNEAYTVSLLDGLKNGGLVVDEALTETYKTYIKEARAKAGKPKNWLAAMMGAKEPVEEMGVSEELAKSMAEKSEIAIITIGRNSGEGGDREAKEGDFYLTETEKSMIRNVSDAFHVLGKKAIVILNIGGAIEVASWRDLPDAVLCAWQPGQEAGNSVVDVLTGKVNPSGKLAVTFPIKYEDVPSSKNFPGVAVESDKVDNSADMSGFSFMQRVPWEVVYEEDIYVGYRYYGTFGVPVAYEFGYGLSYTDFEYSNLKLSADKFKDQITVSIDVKNTGVVAGRESVQVYLKAPENKLEKPSQELVDFGKTRELAPGESQTLSFVIEPMDLCSFDEASTSWVAEAGTYLVKIGASSQNIKGTAEFTLADDRIEKVVSKALAPEREIDKLSNRR
jgi:beta-glucosidase